MDKIKIVFFCFLFTFSVDAQINTHRNITVEDGLVQSTIMSIFQDSKGYIWIGTTGGLSKWNGINFENFSTFNGLLHQRITAIAEAANNQILVGTINGLNIYRDGRFDVLGTDGGLLAPDVLSLAGSKSGVVYVGTSRGLNIYDNGKIDTLGTTKDILGTAIKSIYEAEDGTLLIGTFIKGIFIYKDGVFTNYNTSDGMTNNKVNSICEAFKGTFYLGTNNGVNILKNDKLESFSDKNKILGNYISKIVKGDSGELYFSIFGKGVAVYNDNKIRLIDRSTGLMNNYVNTIAKGNHGTLFIGTNGSGVSLYGGGKFVTYNERTGLANNIIMNIAQDSDGNMYFGSNSGDMSILKNSKIINYNLGTSVLGNINTNVFPSKNGQVYVCSANGVQLYNGRSRRFKTLEPLRRIQITSVYEDDDGTTYFGAVRGVYVYKDGKNKWDLGKNSNLYSVITKILKGSDGKFYFSTNSNGLVVRDDDKYQVLKDDNGLSNNILDFIECKNGSFVFATYKGLFIKNGDVIDTLTTRDGLSDNTIYSVLEGDDGEIYATTNRGLNIIDLSLNPVTVRVLTHSDGLASDECNQTSLYKDTEGKIWIGTVKGVSCYNPSKDLPADEAPNVHLTRVRLFEDDIPLNDFFQPVNFRYNENYFKFDFIGIDIVSPQNVIYKYRLVGLDKDWYETNQRYVQYTNLNDGDYQFEVMARNEWGYWSKPAVVSFSIMAPFWEEWWFISITLLFIIAAVTLFVTYRIRQLLAIERLRTKIAADLHDNIGASLTEISILGEVLATTVDKSNTDLKKGLNNIAETSRTLIDKMSDIVWLVNPKRDSLYDLILRLKDSHTDLFYHKGISFKSNNLKSLEKVSLTMETRQHLYLIFKEAINNSLKHSNCSEIVLDANVQGKNLNMILRDNGSGFDAENNSFGNGVNNMKSRATAIGGMLLIDSHLGKGTLVKFQGSIL